jgi:hypothetical protein
MNRAERAALAASSSKVILEVLPELFFINGIYYGCSLVVALSYYCQMVAILKMQYLRCSAHVTEGGRQVASVVDPQIGDTQCLISVIRYLQHIARLFTSGAYFR